MPVVGLLGGSLAVAVPLVFGALGGVLGERSGVVNIAIDGQLLFGAFGAAMVGSLAGSTWAGLAAAMVAGLLVAAVLGLFAINYFVDQVIVGVVLNVLVIGLTSFMFSQVLAPNAATLNYPPRFERVPIPVLGDIPLIGPIFFRQTVIVYLLYITVALVTWALYRTKWGLRVRAVGEHPKAADTVGIKVNRTRFRTILLAGAIAGMGGAFYTLVSVPQFNREMTGGAGYIALAAVIFGKWDPIKATLAALLFGFASNLQGVLSVIGSPVPSQFMLMLPYVVTIFAVAGLVGRSRATRRRRHPVPRRRPLAPPTPIRLRRRAREVAAEPQTNRCQATVRASTATPASSRAATSEAPSSTRRLPWWRSNVGPPGVRVPRRPIAPGMASRNQAKSSPPRLCVVLTRPSGPSTRSTAPASSWVAATSLTTGGTPRR